MTPAPKKFTRLALILLFLPVLACRLLTTPPPATLPPIVETPSRISSTATHNPPTPAASPEITFSTASVTYYEITGQSAEDLRAQMDLYGPTADGYKGDAAANWYITWDWPGYGTTHCDLSQATTTLEVIVTLPQWEIPADASPELKEHWQTYLNHLYQHEQGHVDLYYQYYPQVKEAIRDATCSQADAAAQAVLETIRAADRAYDSQTGHGQTQGAVFP